MPIELDVELDMRAVRALLAAERISHTQFARACGLNRAYASRLLAGSQQPGELARIKMARGLVALGLDRQASLNALLSFPSPTPPLSPPIAAYRRLLRRLFRKKESPPADPPAARPAAQRVDEKNGGGKR